ncbi:serine hydrolase domain-containing protein [Microbispora siamensis]
MGLSKSGFSEAGLRRLREVLARHVESGKIPGLVALVGRGDETYVEAIGTMFHDGGAPMRRDTIFRMASTSKPVTIAAAMVLLDECRLRLDDPVDPWLPELADRRVLKRFDGPLDDTVPALRPITVRDVLTSTFGLGMDMTSLGTPIMNAVFKRGLTPNVPVPMPEPDEWMRRLGELPLMHQPGERWQYQISSDLVGVLVSHRLGRQGRAPPNRATPSSLSLAWPVRMRGRRADLVGGRSRPRGCLLGGGAGVWGPVPDCHHPTNLVGNACVFGIVVGPASARRPVPSERLGLSLLNLVLLAGAVTFAGRPPSVVPPCPRWSGAARRPRLRSDHCDVIPLQIRLRRSSPSR